MERILFATSVAAEIYGRTGADMDDPPGVGWLVRRMLGDRAIQPAPWLTVDAAVTCDRDRRRILMRPGLSRERRVFAAAHELGECELQRYASVPGGDREAIANLIAACLIAPWPAFVSATLALGEDLPALARAFVTTESMVALRWGETRGEPVALLTPRRMLTRGEAYPWPVPGSDTAARPGLRSVRIRDAEKRFAIFSTT